MADGGELTAAAATGDLKVCFLKAAFLLYVDVNLNYISIVKAILWQAKCSNIQFVSFYM